MPMSDTDIVERLRWQKRYTNGIVTVTMEDAAKEIERLRAELAGLTRDDIETPHPPAPGQCAITDVGESTNPR